MRLRPLVIGVLTLAPFAPFAMSAQGRGHDHVPPGQMPPAGTCRIWLDGLPPGHQPLPTDCQSAFRDAPPDARVLVGAGVDAGDYNREKHDHGDHDDDAGQPAPVPPPSQECLAYTAGGQCAEVYAPAGGPPVLPDMIGAVFASEGRAWPEVQRWLGGLRLTARVDATLAGRPTRVRWTDPNGVVVQEWIDTNGDGRAEIVRVYRQGVLVHTYHQ
jgi:hypothetical protein